MIDLKYHIASLAAVFLALALGILIGTTMIGSDAILAQQEKLVMRLQARFDSLQEENQQGSETIAELETDLDRQQEFNRWVVPELVAGKLTGHRIAIVDLYSDSKHDDLISVLQMAGANVDSITVVNTEQLKKAEIQTEIEKLLDKDPETERADLYASFAQYLAQIIIHGGDTNTCSFLEDREIIGISGNYGLPVDEFIFIGGRKIKDDQLIKSFDLTVLSFFEECGLQVFAVEESSAPVSCMRFYQKVQVTTVDNIDSIHGQIALIRAMEGFPGNYGVKETADSFLPSES